MVSKLKEGGFVLLLVALALCAVVASSASAALPELTRAGKSEALKYEIRGESAGSLEYETVSGMKEECTTAKLKGGKAINTKEIGGIHLLMTGCKENVFKFECNSAGKKGGEIESVALTGKIGYISKPESKKTEVGLELRPTEENAELTKPLVKYECSGGFSDNEWRRTIVGTLGAGQHNKATLSLNLAYNKGTVAGLQEDTGIEGGYASEAYLEGSMNRGTFEKMNWQVPIVLKYGEDESMELKA
jgi:hypothetical protein